MNHTPEPWEVYPEYDVRFHIIRAGSLKFRFNTTEAYWIADLDADGTGLIVDECEANARRIVACVNACTGLTPEQVEALPRLVAWFRERDVSWGEETWDSKTDELHRIFPEDSK